MCRRAWSLWEDREGGEGGRIELVGRRGGQAKQFRLSDGMPDKRPECLRVKNCKDDEEVRVAKNRWWSRLLHAHGRLGARGEG